MSPRLLIVMLAMLGLVSAAPARAPADPVVTLISDVRIFDGNKVIEHGSVLIANGRIAAVGRRVAAPKGARIVDGRGKTLLPGLIDGHVHVTDSYATAGALALEQGAAYGITTMLEMGTSDPNTYQGFERNIKAGKYPRGADLFSAGPPATAPGGHGDMRHLNPTLTAPDQAEEWVLERIRSGSDYIKVISETFAHRGGNTPTLSAETLAAVVAAAHRHGKLAVAHTLEPARARAAVLAGIDGLVHITPYYPPQADFGALLKAHRVFQSTNMIAYAPLTYKTELAADADLRRMMPPYMIDGLAHPRPFAANANHAYSIGTLKLLIAAGVPIVAGTDIGYPYSPLLHAELAIMVRDGGMTPIQALRAATSTPARMYRLADRGRIARGLRADLLLVAGDPTRDILATRRIAAVWINGREIDREATRKAVLVAPVPAPMGPPPK